VPRRPYPLVLVALLLAGGCDRGSRPALIGRPAPDFSVQDSERNVALRQLRGKVVVLNFWATWCPPCVEEMPSLTAMQQRLADHVVVLAVSTDTDEAAYRRFLREHNINLLTVRDAQQSSNQLYGTVKFPESYVIDPRGIVRRKFVGPVDWTGPEILEYLKQVSSF